MGLFDKIKNMVTEEDEDYDYDTEIAEEQEEDYFGTVKSTKSDNARRTNTAGPVGAGIQVVLVKPERYEDVTSIADHLNDRKTVVLNLESADKDLSRRIVDFLSGATYANHGNLRKVSKGTFLIVPNGVDMMGEVMLDDFDENRMYF